MSTLPWIALRQCDPTPSRERNRSRRRARAVANEARFVSGRGALIRLLRALLLSIVFIFPVTGNVFAERSTQSLVIFSWEDYMPPALVSRFEAETGINVTVDEYQSNEEMLAALTAGTALYDVIVPTGYMVDIMINKDLLLPIDVRSMPNFKNVNEYSSTPWFDRDRLYTAPFTWGTTGFFYDSAQVEGGCSGGKLEGILRAAAGACWKDCRPERPALHVPGRGLLRRR